MTLLEVFDRDYLNEKAKIWNLDFQFSDGRDQRVASYVGNWRVRSVPVPLRGRTMAQRPIDRPEVGGQSYRLARCAILSAVYCIGNSDFSPLHQFGEWNSPNADMLGRHVNQRNEKQ